MKYLAAYLMAVVAEEPNPSKEKVASILKSIGAEIDQAILDAFFSKIEGKNVSELISTGLSKLTSFAAAAPAAGAACPAAAGGKAAAAAAAPAKEEEEEDAGDMDFSLFD